MWPKYNESETLVPPQDTTAKEEAEERALNGTPGPYGELGILRHSLPITALYCFAYMLVLVLGLVGNVLVLMVVLRTRIMRSTIFYFLFNLALADLLVLICCLPATLISNVYTRESRVPSAAPVSCGKMDGKTGKER